MDQIKELNGYVEAFGGDLVPFLLRVKIGYIGRLPLSERDHKTLMDQVVETGLGFKADWIFNDTPEVRRLLNV